MLEGLDRFIAGQKNRDLLIVLHQMGNHGPEYYRRYPQAFERYVPVCMQSQLKKCTREAVDNAYDNAILYTDYFLSRTIALLKKYDGQFQTMMLYVSDHGESLGENGVYLHAAPYETAPKEQKHIPVILWLGKQFDVDPEWARYLDDQPISHDDLFCALMTGYRVQTQACSAWETALSQKLQRPAPHAARHR
jgi:lipid A ethanolaminephosphotransferase